MAAGAGLLQPSHWGPRLLWLAAIWTTSVLALGTVAACLRLVMMLAGLTA